LIYNTSFSNSAVAVLNFGADKTATSGTFTIQFPAFTTAAIIRISSYIRLDHLTGFETFSSAVGNGNTTYYAISSKYYRI
jgi:hypothetical protein